MAVVDPAVVSVARWAHDYARSADGWKRSGRRSWSRGAARDVEPSDVGSGSAGRSATGAPGVRLTCGAVGVRLALPVTVPG